MTSFVVATAGHVDHGKSTLVRALTGMEPDRWEEERRRGLTIDLGFAWTTLPSGRGIAFVDVPGHERFVGNMLAGLGPAPVVLFVVAADQGWQRQSDDHLAAAAALGIRHGVVAVTRCDLAPDAVGAVRDEVRARLRSTELADAAIVPVSGRTGEGLDALRAALDRALDAVPLPQDDAPVRFWIDRAFTIAGAGTVVTGTLAAGRLARGDALDLVPCGSGHDSTRAIELRGLHVSGVETDAVTGASRVAANVRGVAVGEVHRGDALVAHGAWWRTSAIDVRLASGAPLDALPERLVAHIGTAAVRMRLRAFSERHARVQLERSLPLHVGDRLVLRDPGGDSVRGGVEVLDLDPPVLQRRGAGARRDDELGRMTASGSVTLEVERRRVVAASRLQSMGIAVPATLPAGIVRIGERLVASRALAQWAASLRRAVERDAAADALSAGLTHGAAADAIGLPEPSLLGHVVRLAGLESRAGRIRPPHAPAALGAAEPGLARLERSLAAQPFDAPEADELRALGLGARELAAAERVGRLLRLGDGIVLLPSAPARAMRELAALAQPFTTSEARQALATTRRVAIPLLEHLDARGWTRRLDAQHREVVRASR